MVSVDLPPSVTVELDRSLLAGIALEGGSRTSHAAILARSLGIPAVVAVAGLLDAVNGAHELALDGSAGTVAIDPDEAVGRRRTRDSLPQLQNVPRRPANAPPGSGPSCRPTLTPEPEVAPRRCSTAGSLS